MNSLLDTEIAGLINAGTDVTLQADNDISTAADLVLSGTGALTLDASNDITIAHNITNSSTGNLNFTAGNDINQTAGTITTTGIATFNAANVLAADLNIAELILENTQTANLTGIINSSTNADGAKFTLTNTTSANNQLFNGKPLRKTIIIPRKVSKPEEIEENSGFNYEPFREKLKNTPKQFTFTEVSRERLHPIYAYTTAPKRTLGNLDRFLLKSFLAIDLDFHPFKETNALDAWIPVYEAYWSYILGRNVLVR